MNESEYVNFAGHTLADKSGAIYHKHGDETLEINPKGGPWPVAGFTASEKNHPEGWPKKIRVTASKIAKWEDRGLLTIENRDVVMSPAGPKDNPWKGSAGTRKNHEFVTGSAIIFHGKIGDSSQDVKYRVVRSPGKYYTSDNKVVSRESIARYGEPCEIHWDYLLELET